MVLQPTLFKNYVSRVYTVKGKKMMYQSKLVASLKANGKILREFKDTVYIPFGSEYSILLKNLNTTRALVSVFLDGENVVPGGLVINPGQELDLERWIKNGNLSEGNRFKFIERTATIEDGPRGIKLEDGLVRIEFQYEQPPRGVAISNTWISASGSRGFPNSTTYSSTSYNVNGAMRGVDFSKGENMKASATSAMNSTLSSMGISASASEVHDGMASMDWNDVGITVPGSKSTQKFATTHMGQLEAEKHTIVLKLLGETPDNKPVVKPVTVKAKPKCVTCGHNNKATAKFCSECGTALEIFA